jgi:zinc/manganese transport system ATP-binding protein
MPVSVTLKNLTLSYNRHPAVHHVSGHFPSGSLTAIAGPNGAGKSTLLKAIAGLTRPDEGQVSIDKSPGERIAYLPQAADLQRDFPLSLLHMVCTGFWHITGGHGSITPAMKTTAQEAIANVGLRGLETRALSSLSAGQFQRALFARLLVQDASLILLDEPFNAIDESTTRHLMEIIARWHAESRTVICVLHDFEQIRQHFPDCLLLARESIAWGASATVLTPENLLNARFFRPDWNVPSTLCGIAV